MTKDEEAARPDKRKKNAEALAAALRANLHRRKAARAANAPPPAASQDEPGPSKEQR